MVAEDDVEALVLERHVLGARLDQRKLDPGLGHRRPRVLELLRGQVQSDRPRPQPGERDRPLRRAAAELEHVLPGHVSEDLQLRLRDLPHAPREARILGQLLGVTLLVRVALALPVGAVLIDVVGQGAPA